MLPKYWRLFKPCNGCHINQHYYPQLLARLKRPIPVKRPLQHGILLPHILRTASSNLVAPRRQIDRNSLPKDFYNDSLGVTDDSPRHFLMLSVRLAQLGAACGDFPAYDGLWQATVATKHDMLAGLVIAPLVLEARRQDVTTL